MKTILIVDDKKEIGKMLGEILKDLGYNPIICESGEQAIQYLGETDALITDFNMNGMRGDELAEKAKERRHDMPVIIMTGYPSQVPLGYEVIPKPLDFGVIDAWLRSVTR